MSSEGKAPEMVRVPLSFDCSDETQRMVCEILKSAGYGKRTPIVVKAVCLLMGRAGQAETGGVRDEDRIAAIVRAAVTEALRDALPRRESGMSVHASFPTMAQQNVPEQIHVAPKNIEEERTSAADRLAGYDLPEDIISSALAFADQFG